MEAAAQWLRETGQSALTVPVAYRTPEKWGTLGDYPLGVFLTDQRRHYAAGTLEADRVVQLEALGMVWAVHTRWDDMMAVARSYTDTHGHFVPPTTAVWEGQPIGNWARNQRQAARRATHNTLRRAAGEQHVPSTGELTQARREALDEIDPEWCPVWDTEWQRALRLCQTHVRAGGTLPDVAGQVIIHGQDLGTWDAAQRAGWDRLMPAQQYLLAALGLEPAGEDEQPSRRSQSAAWARNITAARQFHAREGHLTVPRTHVETVDGEAVGLGRFVNNARRRAATLSPQRRADLDQLGMRW
ncbi:helicase associated domain-containing protein [Streptomyces sp. NPDC007070]|uniref:helicase associated domain-containing protein n=1 Tax=Streptomyces sp. NPDC007070 TaxID=3154312 RepID=UPI0033D3ADFA